MGRDGRPRGGVDWVRTYYMLFSIILGLVLAFAAMWLLRYFLHAILVFVVSGFLACDSWIRDPSLGRYLLRRSLRVLPGLAVVVILSALLLGPALTTRPLAEYFADPQFARYFWNLALAHSYALPGLFGGNWTLPAEFAMYLLLPLHGTAASPLCRRVLLPAALLASGAAGYHYALHPAEM